MNNAVLSGYKRKSKEALLKAIDECTSLSQLFALIQHEQIEIQMHAQDGASGVKQKKLSPQDIIANKELPLDRLKAVWATQTLSELFALIQKEHIVIQMHAQSGASNVAPKKLKPKVTFDKNESPFERFKAEVVKSLSEQQE